MNEKMPEGLRWSIGWIFYTCIQPYILLTIADLELIREQNISIFKLMPGIHFHQCFMQMEIYPHFHPLITFFRY